MLQKTGIITSIKVGQPIQQDHVLATLSFVILPPKISDNVHQRREILMRTRSEDPTEVDL